MDLHLIVEEIRQEENRDLCFLNHAAYDHIDGSKKWAPVNRLLVDSDQQHIIYIVDVDGQWTYVRFPVDLWKTIDAMLHKGRDPHLVVAASGAGGKEHLLPLKDFCHECLELVENMFGNHNYGEEMSDLVKEHFPQTTRHLHA